MKFNNFKPWIIQTVIIYLIRLIAILFLNEVIYVPMLYKLGRISIFLICFILPKLLSIDIYIQALRLKN